jgi:hypothetical protein
VIWPVKAQMLETRTSANSCVFFFF